MALMSHAKPDLSDDTHKVIIIGAGLAGLACARVLQEQDFPFLLCEASDRVGGRVATDLVDGYRLDRGFQVLLTDYPEARRMLDYHALDLRPFYPGALVRCGGAWHRVADPVKHPLDAVRGVFSPIGTLFDKLRVAVSRVHGFDFSRHGRGLSSIEALRAEGYSETIIQRFFRPFLGGVFLENRLETSVAKLDFVMNHFSRGETVIPARGMAEIPRQLAEALPTASIRLNTRVKAIQGMQVLLENGDRLTARAIVIATEAGGATALLQQNSPAPAFHRAGCLYYSADRAPVDEPILLLNGEDSGPINNLTVLSHVSPDYAPAGKHLISVSIVDNHAAENSHLVAEVQTQLRQWFGHGVDAWKLLRHDKIPCALPVQRRIADQDTRLAEGIYQCGDHFGVASINTALASGRAAAEAILCDLMK